MKRFLLATFLSATFLTASAGTMRMVTSAEPGTKVKILLNASSATAPVSIDWGNGVAVNYTVDPSQPAYNRWIEGTIEGANLTISGNVTEADLGEIGLTEVEIEGMNRLVDLDLAQNQITRFELLSLTPLQSLNLSYNNLINNTYDLRTLSLEYAGETLTNLNVAHNDGLICLDIRDLTELEYLTANDCEQLGSIFICMPEDKRDNLRSINLTNCDLAHFYPVSLPNLRSLNLGNNNLMTSADTDPFVLGNYPELTTLDVSNNANIDYLDITGCKKLTNLNISNNNFELIDVTQAPDLEVLYAANNKLSSIDLGNNGSLRTLDISGNPIRELDVNQFPYMRSLNVSNTQISRIMLMNASFLEDFRASNTLIEFIDFNGQQAQRMRIIDLRDNSRMTGRTVNYTIHTLPEAKGTAASANLLLSGSNGETADISYATSIDMHWVCDITGDGTAKYDEFAVNLIGATDTGENKTGVLDRLYPIFGMSLEYDFDIYQGNGGQFLISQWQPVYFQKMNSVTDKAMAGVPIHVYPYPEEGKRFRSVTVNGEEIFSQWFVIDGPADIKVNFTDSENAFVFKSIPGNPISMLVNTLDNNGTVYVDWGTGNRTEYKGMNKYTSGYAELGGTRIDGTATGDGTVTVYGDVAGVDLSGFGEYGLMMGLWDNQVKEVNLSGCPDLKYLNLYWNPVEVIDLSGAQNLEVLNVGYTALTDIDLSTTPALMWLDAHSDGFGDEPGITMMSSIDVTKLPILQYLDMRGNELTQIDLSANPYLRWVNLNNNEITSVDFSHNPLLEEIDMSSNKLTTLNVSAQPELVSLTAGRNNLTAIDLSANTKIGHLYLDNNDIHDLDLSALKDLRRVTINGNGMTADELNDIYYRLPQRYHGADDEDPNQLKYNLTLIQGGDRTENDATRADSSIADDRGWTPSHAGSNGGSDFAYLDIYNPVHGTFTVTDEKGNEYKHGSKAPKWTTLTINAVPEEGYKMTTYSLNGEEEIAGNTFDMPGIYTKLRVNFAKGSGIEDTEDAVAVRAEQGGVSVSADNATIDIFSAEGKAMVVSETVNGTRHFSLGEGIYIVRVASAAGTRSHKVLVK